MAESLESHHFLAPIHARFLSHGIHPVQSIAHISTTPILAIDFLGLMDNCCYRSSSRRPSHGFLTKQSVPNASQRAMIRPLDPPQHGSFVQEPFHVKLDQPLAAEAMLGNTGSGLSHPVSQCHTGCGLSLLVPASDLIRFFFDNDLILRAEGPH